MFNLPARPIKWANEIIVFLYFITNIGGNDNSNNPRSFPNLYPFLGVTLVLFISLILNNSEFVTSLFYYRFFLAPMLFYWAVYNTSFDEHQKKLINTFLIYLYAFQIVAQILKAIIYGSFVENPVGTLTVHGGGVASFIPLFAFGFLLSFYIIYKQEKKYWLYMAAFMLVGILSQKRAAFYFLPLVSLFFVILYNMLVKRKSIVKQFRLIGIIVIVVPILIYIGAKNNPILTSKRSFDGSSVSIRVILFQHAAEYYSAEMAYGGYAFSRFQSSQIIWARMLNDDFLVQLFGYGPDTVKGFGRGDGKMEQFGLAGTFPGWVFQYIQSGILSCIFYVLLYLGFLKNVYRVAKRETDPYWKAVEMGTMIMILLLFVDFIIYGTTLLSIYPFTFTIAYLCAVIQKRVYILLKASSN